jgi:hypothetical protein
MLERIWYVYWVWEFLRHWQFATLLGTTKNRIRSLLAVGPQVHFL